MKILKYNVCISLFLFSAQTVALNLVGSGQSTENALYDNRSCNDLYMQASALEKDSHIYKSNFYNDRKTRVASVALTAFSPALYYLGFNSYQNYKKQLQSEIAFSQIEEIRFRMAEKRCFEKY